MKILNNPFIQQYSAKKEQNNSINTQSKPVLKTLNRDTVKFGFNPTENAIKVIKEYAKKGWSTMIDETIGAIEIIGKEKSIEILQQNGAKPDRVKSIINLAEREAEIKILEKQGVSTEELIERGLMIHWEGGTAG